VLPAKREASLHDAERPVPAIQRTAELAFEPSLLTLRIDRTQLFRLGPQFQWDSRDVCVPNVCRTNWEYSVRPNLHLTPFQPFL